MGQNRQVRWQWNPESGVPIQAGSLSDTPVGRLHMPFVSSRDGGHVVLGGHRLLLSVSRDWQCMAGIECGWHGGGRCGHRASRGAGPAACACREGSPDGDSEGAWGSLLGRAGRKSPAMIAPAMTTAPATTQPPWRLCKKALLAPFARACPVRVRPALARTCDAAIAAPTDASPRMRLCRKIGLGGGGEPARVEKGGDAADHRHAEGSSEQAGGVVNCRAHAGLGLGDRRHDRLGSRRARQTHSGLLPREGRRPRDTGCRRRW